MGFPVFLRICVSWACFVFLCPFIVNTPSPTPIKDKLEQKGCLKERCRLPPGLQALELIQPAERKAREPGRALGVRPGQKVKVTPLHPGTLGLLPLHLAEAAGVWGGVLAVGESPHVHK